MAKNSLVFNINYSGNGSCFNMEGKTNTLESLIKTKEHPELPITMDWGVKSDAKDAISFAKVHIFPDGSFCFKVSADCIKKGIYEKSIIGRVQSNNIASMPIKFKAGFLSDPMVLLHGYFSTVVNESITKSGAMRITSAREVQEDDKVSPVYRHELVLEQSFKTPMSGETNSKPFTRSGGSCSKNFMSEDCTIDLSELQFISNDKLHGRNALLMSIEDINTYIELLKAQIGDDDIHYGMFKKPHEADFVGEYGIKLGKSAVKKIVNMGLHAILDAQWNKLRGSLKVDSITMSNANGDVTITKDNVDDFDFDFEESYIEITDPAKIDDWDKANAELDKKREEAKKAREKEDEERKSKKNKKGKAKEQEESDEC